MKKLTFYTAFLLIAAAAPTLAITPAPAAVMPHTFTSGDTIKASEVNENFAAAIDSINNITLTPGPQGPAGAVGAQGIAGAPGLQGADGADGADGAQGVVGPIGPIGVMGANGFDGLDGTNGTNGADGQPGPAGVDAPDRTAALCALYQDLSDSSMLFNVTVPDFCQPQPIVFVSTVSHVYNQGGGLPSGIAVDDTVSFALHIPLSQASQATSFGSCFSEAIDCYEAAWTFPAPVQYVLTYSSGHTQVGQIDRIELRDGGVMDFGGLQSPEYDAIKFYDASNDIWEVINHQGTAFTGPLPGDLASAISGIDQTGLFDRTHYWGNWGNWGTYHYDYIKPQGNTIVTGVPH